MNPDEAIARALCRADCERGSPGHGGGKWCDAFGCPAWQEWTPGARAALAAIRMPTPGMVEAMMTEFEHNGACADLWRAAIDAAMEE